MMKHGVQSADQSSKGLRSRDKETYKDMLRTSRKPGPMAKALAAAAVSVTLGVEMGLAAALVSATYMLTKAMLGEAAKFNSKQIKRLNDLMRR